ncbi:unnamed protein product [Ambrosiozyma monospora]|uniref:Unnamed protein product n=1 Tax=Ambrosiozyma monospora TaxID=43982 RepID=A0ACB5STD0_AMBMO|nr:unnamed protein product [Ambrosiozyma monospora]
MSSSHSKVQIQGIGYDPTVGPRSTGPTQAPLPATPTMRGGQLSSPSTPITSSTPAIFSTRSNSLKSSGSNAIGGLTSIYDRNLHRAKHEISLSSLSFLFMEMISINLNTSKSVVELERKLNNLGYTIGLKYLELASLRVNFNNNLTSSGKSNTAKRDIKILEILQFVVSTIWTSLFGKPADNLEKSSEFNNQFMIIDNAPLLTRYISMPKEYENLNCEAFIAGLIEGVLDSSYFKCEVSAHGVPIDNFPTRTVFLIKFDESVMKREARLAGK